MKNILWVDDDAKMLAYCVPIFEKHGFHVYQEKDITSALNVLRTSTLDGVILDKLFPTGDNGMELLPELRHRYPDLPIVLFTGHHDLAEHAEAMEMGVVYLGKEIDYIPSEPVKQEQFFAGLHTIFARRQNTARLPLSNGMVQPVTDNQQPLATEPRANALQEQQNEIARKWGAMAGYLISRLMLLVFGSTVAVGILHLYPPFEPLFQRITNGPWKWPLYVVLGIDGLLLFWHAVREKSVKGIVETLEKEVARRVEQTLRRFMGLSS